jgi:MFS family permease
LPPRRSDDRRPERLQFGIRANLAQFTLLVAVNALVGGMLGQERTVLPLLAQEEFGLAGATAAMTFIVAFGLVKAITNFVAGTLSDRFGRKPVLVAGWLFGLPVPLLLIWAPSWSWVIAANVLLGINQGLAWSTTVIMKIDLAGPHRRGLAMGLNEAAGYLAVSATALLTGFIAARAGLRPEPFYVGVAYTALGLGLSTLAVRETRDHAAYEAATSRPGRGASGHDPTLREVIVRTSFTEPSLSAASQAGMINNLNDGMAWGLLPLFFAAAGLSISRIGILAAVYPAIWGFGQLVTGAWSDRVGRKRLIVAGMWTQALAIGVIGGVGNFAIWLAAMALLGVGTALVYPTLLAAVGDLANPRWRASAVGVYRFWRDAGFALGAILTGIIADLASASVAIWTVAALTAISGTVVAVRMQETHGRRSIVTEPSGA